jgi:CheY-like chemotaxis protein
MLPTRAYGDLLPPLSARIRPEPSARDARPVLVAAVAASDVARLPSAPFAPLAATSTADALRLIERWRPRLVVVDWDHPDFDAPAICTTARQHAGTGVLATMASPRRAPSAVRAGCHAVLLEPLTPNLLAARLGRLFREMPTAALTSPLSAMLGQPGTNRAWPEMSCPECGGAGATSFEHSSHRRMWFACLACDAVWLGRRQE